MSMRIDQQEVTKNNIGQVRALLEATLPVRYTDKFYADLCANFPKDNRLARLGYHNEALVAVVTGRREVFDPSNVVAPGRIFSAKEDLLLTEAGVAPKDEHHRVYISTVAVLSAYRQRGACTALFRKLMEDLEQDKTIEQVYLHVHVDNAVAIRMYEGYGFTRAALLEGYFKIEIISPPDAILLIKNLRQ